MNILLAGASANTEAAIRLIASSVFRGTSLHLLERAASGSSPQQSVAALRCRLCVVDVHGLGWSQWYPEHAARLELLLAGRAAVLLLPPNSSGGWYDHAQLASAQHRILLRRPVSDAAVAYALRSAGAEAARVQDATDHAYLSSNIWMQTRPTQPAPLTLPTQARLSDRTRRLKFLTSLKKNVFHSAVSALFLKALRQRGLLTMARPGTQLDEKGTHHA